MDQGTGVNLQAQLRSLPVLALGNIPVIKPISPRASKSLSMTIATFKVLHQRLQAEHLTRYGSRLAEREEDGFDLTLYAVKGFYAEIWRSRGEEAILFIHVFQKPAGLSDYLRLVQLPAGL